MSQAESGTLPAHQRRRLRVLLVEDDVSDVALMEDVFSDLTDRAKLSICPDAPGLFFSLRTVGALLPDVLLLDLHIRAQSGLDLLADLKCDPQLCRIPVVMLSGSSDPRKVAQAYRHHASAYMVKPMSHEQLRAQMDALVTFWCCCALLG